MIGGDELRNRRRAAGLTQAELAAKLDVAPRSIRNWESAHVPDIREREINRVLPALSVVESHLTGSLYIPATRDSVVNDAMNAMEFFQNSIAGGATRPTIERGMSAVIDSLREMGTLDAMDRTARRSLINLMTFPIVLERDELALAASDPAGEEGPDGEDLETER